jgi:hypothetical protein
MSSDIWGAVAAATGVWIIATFTVIGTGPKPNRLDGVVWTAASSDKVASHPTLVRRSLATSSVSWRNASLNQSR